MMDATQDRIHEKDLYANIAMRFAQIAHGDQKRKYTGEPYWHHCREVAFLVDMVGGTKEQICAAWLHDTIEDTQATYEEIKNKFGHVVAGFVEALTDVSKPSDGNRTKRKEMDRSHTSCACPAAKTVKLADLISNSISINRHDPDFAVVYMKEKRLLLDVLREGNPILWKIANDIVDRYYAEIQR